MTSTNFGDLRSAVHAEQDREQHVLDVLATYEGDPHRALSYVRDNGVLNIVSKWEGENDIPRNDGGMDSSLWKLGDNMNGPARWDTGPLRGFVNVGGQAIELIHAKHDPQLHQSWALEHVRLPAFDAWNQFFNDQMSGVENTRPWGEVNALIRGMLDVHHPAFIAGQINKDEWARFGTELCDALRNLLDAWRFRKIFGADSAWHSVAALARISTNCTNEQRLAESIRLELHHGAWLIDRFDWNAWGGVQ